MISGADASSSNLNYIIISDVVYANEINLTQSENRLRIKSTADYQTVKWIKHARSYIRKTNETIDNFENKKLNCWNRLLRMIV